LFRKIDQTFILSPREYLHCIYFYLSSLTTRKWWKCRHMSNEV